MTEKWIPPRARPTTDPYTVAPPDPFKFDHQTAEILLRQLCKWYGFTGVNTLEEFKDKMDKRLYTARLHAQAPETKLDAPLLALAEKYVRRQEQCKHANIQSDSIEGRTLYCRDCGRDVVWQDPGPAGGSAIMPASTHARRFLKTPGVPEAVCVAVLLPGGRSSEFRIVGLEGLKGTQLPGGRCNPGETPEQAALRELYEETGLALQKGRRLQPLDTHLVGGHLCVTYWCLAADVCGEFCDSPEGKVVWLRPEDLMLDRPGKPPVRFPAFYGWAAAIHAYLRLLPAKDVVAERKAVTP